MDIVFINANYVHLVNGLASGGDKYPIPECNSIQT
jgi:hypothetical protein